jgi:hypothetical protein
MSPIVHQGADVNSAAAFSLDIAAITIMTFALYFPRHRRRDLVVAYLALNIGVLAVTEALTSTDVTAGLGLGLFGVLSIIRLRSIEISQEEVAYFFVALALGVVGGLPVTPAWLIPALMAALLAGVFIGDHPRLFRRYRFQAMTLDHAFTSEPVLIDYLENILCADVHRVTVRRVDLVNDTTQVEVRFRLLDPDSSDTPDAGLQVPHLVQSGPPA